jgi:mannose-6-phosphate isomerase
VTLFLIGNQPMPYAWGSEHLIQDLTGLGQIGEPAAEVWFGSHPTAPSKLLSGDSGTLADIAPDLPFLVKFLAAQKPLSIQAHPSRQRAKDQFGAGHKSYSDANHKPEMIIAISEFEALCGFRDPEEIRRDLGSLANQNPIFQPLQQAFEHGGIKGALQFAFDNNLAQELLAELAVLDASRQQLVSRLAADFPGDVGVMIGGLMLQHVVLAKGEALFMPAGNIHSYLKGLGVEVMASSNNVLRGGLTQKPIDVPELMQVLDFSPLQDPRVVPVKVATGLTHYPAEVSDFSVYGVDVSGTNMLIDLELRGSMIVVCVSGELEISTSAQEYQKLSRGQAAFVADARLFSITGSGAGYLAMG